MYLCDDSNNNVEEIFSPKNFWEQLAAVLHPHLLQDTIGRKSLFHRNHTTLDTNLSSHTFCNFDHFAILTKYAYCDSWAWLSVSA